MASNIVYVIVKHAPGGQELIWQGQRKALLQRKKERYAGMDYSAWYEVRPATEADDLSCVKHVQITPSVMLHR